MILKVVKVLGGLLKRLVECLSYSFPSFQVSYWSAKEWEENATCFIKQSDKSMALICDWNFINVKTRDRKKGNAEYTDC